MTEYDEAFLTQQKDNNLSISKNELMKLQQKKKQLNGRDLQMKFQDQDRYWEYILKKISFKPKLKVSVKVKQKERLSDSDQEYYKQDVFKEVQLKPGLNFWKILAKSKLPLDQLTVNIPQTCISNEGTLIFMYTDENTGKIIRKPEANYNEFEISVLNDSKKFLNELQSSTQLNKEMIDYYDPTKNEEFPFIVSRISEEDQYCTSKCVFQ